MPRGRKYEEKSINFALYSQVVREGGYRVPIIMRFSIIPGHCGSLSPLSPGCLCVALMHRDGGVQLRRLCSRRVG